MQTTYQTPLEIGATVYGSDGEKIGDIAEIQNEYFIVEKGFIFTTDLYIPMSAVASRDGDGVRLSMTKSDIEDGDWSSPPVGSTEPVGYDEDTSDAPAAAAMGTAGVDRDRDVLERREERLQVDKERERAGSVHVGKHVVEEEQSVDVPVTREEVHLERRSVDRPATGQSLTEDSIDVPVYEERAEADKEARVVEELEVDKTQKTGTQRVSGTVRREEFDVDDDTTRP